MHKTQTILPLRGISEPPPKTASAASIPVHLPPEPYFTASQTPQDAAKMPQDSENKAKIEPSWHQNRCQIEVVSGIPKITKIPSIFLGSSWDFRFWCSYETFLWQCLSRSKYVDIRVLICLLKSVHGVEKPNKYNVVLHFVHFLTCILKYWINMINKLYFVIPHPYQKVEQRCVIPALMP